MISYVEHLLLGHYYIFSQSVLCVRELNFFTPAMLSLIEKFHWYAYFLVSFCLALNRVFKAIAA